MRRKIESVRGSRLLPVADFHVGSDCTLMISHALPTIASVPAPPLPGTAGTLGMGPNGGMGMYGAGGYSANNMGMMGTMGAMGPYGGYDGMNNSSSMSLMNGHMQSGLPGQSGQQPPVAGTQPFGTTLDKVTTTKSCVLVGTADGSIGLLLPVDEKMYRRLALLQQLMSMGVRTALSFNPKTFRMAKSSTRVRICIAPSGTTVASSASSASGGPSTNPSKGIVSAKADNAPKASATATSNSRNNVVLDGTLLWKYVGLDVTQQEELAIVIGTTRDVILENLNRLDRCCSFF